MSTGVTNFFFNNQFDSNEQSLIQSLVTEAIAIAGEDVYYIPRTINNYDPIYGADDTSSYDQAFMIAMYIENFDGFKGQGSFMSKFDLEIRDQVIFAVSTETFQSEVAVNTNQLRPNEGDLIYFPKNGKCFQVKYTDKYEMFYTLGGLQSYKLTTELFEYSNEKFNTGIPEIDAIQTVYDTDSLDFALLDESGNFINTEDWDFIVNEKFNLNTSAVGSDNTELENEAPEFIDWSTTDPFAEGLD